MENSGGQKNRLSSAGLLLSVIPILLLIVYAICQNRIMLYVFTISGVLLPVAGLILSIAGTRFAMKNEKTGALAGIIGIIISSIELVLDIIYFLLLIFVIIPNAT